MRYRIDMSYDGAPFCGWQIQPGAPSVQETLEKALGTLLRSEVGVTGAGRTDTGVSASCYVAHFDFDAPVPRPLMLPEDDAAPAAHGGLDCAQLRYKLNAMLPESVSISGIAPAADDFHARFSAKRRRYTYFLHRVKDPFLAAHSYFFAYPELDFDAMNRAAALLLGTHDFSCFEKSGGDNKTSVCTVFSARWEPYEPELHSPAPRSADGTERQGCYWRFVIEADRFLRNMVRAIAGTLLELGRGRRSHDNFASLILPPSSRDAETPSRRSEAGESAPGHALFLSGIEY
ncbi:MAG: tRNA pseudouridine(38-40) synthase TruA [Bacteroidales bacterium]|nr:tRNA pseudouridine(38-40) synthase TruA [Bacteroidales bacterium]